MLDAYPNLKAMYAPGDGNTEVYYPLLRKLICTKATLPLLNEAVIQLTKKVDMISSTILNNNETYLSYYDKLSKIEISQENLNKIISEFKEYKVKYNEVTSEMNEYKTKYNEITSKMSEYKSKIEFFEQRPSSLEQIFSVKNQNDHKVIRIFGIKIKFKYKK